MKIVKSTLVYCLLLLSGYIYSQKDETILKIGNHNFSKGEFLHIYNKNQHLPEFNESPKDFFNRFLNYKLKVVEAQNQGLDTVSEFLSEFNKYRDELAESYLIDSSMVEKLVLNAYNNMTRIVSASHILVRFPQNPAPFDTIEAWKKISEFRSRILNGEDFNQIAFNHSEDPSAKQNQGKLGYFTAFQMVYPFEKAAFSTPAGEVSQIVRTVFGYHLIMVHENIPNPGKIRVAHIMKIFTQQPTPEIDAAYKSTIDSIYNLLINGADFATLAKKHSGDSNSSNNGGEMAPFSLNEIIPEFAFPAFNLKENGEISKPIRTPFGWHIIKRIDLKPIEDFKTLKPSIIGMMGNDERRIAGQKAFIDARRKTEAYKLYKEGWERISNHLKDGTISKENFFELARKKDEPLFKYHTKNVLTSDLINYLDKQQSFTTTEGIKGLEKALDEMVFETIKKYEKENLQKTNKQFKYISNEYYDGLLIFEISNREIWTKSESDTTGLYNFYKENIADFSEAPILEGTHCFISDNKIIKKVSKGLKKSGNKNLDEIISKVAGSKNNIKCSREPVHFIITVSNPVKGPDLPESHDDYGKDGVVFWQGNIKPGNPIPYENCKGMVISSYQASLEKNWLNNLKLKHKPIVNDKILNKINKTEKSR